jgi:pathogenesis-related protein 1
MMAVVRSKAAFFRAARQGLYLALIAPALACSSDEDDAGNGGNSAVMTNFPDAQTYVDAHNAVRAAVQKPTMYAGSWSPVPPVTWSNEVATSAQRWANHLRDSMSCGLMHERSAYGENLAAGSNIGAQRAVDMWASEVRNYTYAPAYQFETDTGHYTQIVWRDTREIGCASAQCGGSSVVVCRYHPAGNYVGEQPY